MDQEDCVSVSATEKKKRARQGDDEGCIHLCQNENRHCDTKHRELCEN